MSFLLSPLSVSELLFLQWVRWLLCIFLFMLMSAKRKVLQIINRKSVHSAIIIVYCVPSSWSAWMRGSLSLRSCPLVLSSSRIVGYPPRKRPSYTQWGQDLCLYILSAHCESSKYICWGMSESMLKLFIPHTTHETGILLLRMIVYVIIGMMLRGFQ